VTTTTKTYEPQVYGHSEYGYTIPKEHQHKYNEDGIWNTDVPAEEWVPGDPLPGQPYKGHGRSFLNVKPINSYEHEEIDSWEEMAANLRATLSEEEFEVQWNYRPTCRVCDSAFEPDEDCGANEVMQHHHEHNEWCDAECECISRTSEEHDDIHMRLTRSLLEPWTDGAPENQIYFRPLPLGPVPSAEPA
jgi:hypothetical protein